MKQHKSPSQPPIVRVRFVYDEGARFAECNGESRPLTEAEYAEHPYRACPQHWRAGTTVLDSGGTDRPQVQGCAVCSNTKYAPIPYAEYRAYYGNPDRHVYLGVEAHAQCPCCQAFTGKSSSVWGIDCMDDDRELSAIHVGEWRSAEDASKLPGYAGDMAREQIGEVQG